MKNIGSLSIHKGKIGEIAVKVWDVIPVCDANCPLWEEECPYDKNKTRCELRRQYIESVFSSLSNAIKDKDQLTIHRVGMLLMPLYTSLISIKLEVHAKQGGMRSSRGGVDPIYKELRETIKLIDSMLKDLGIDKEKGGSGNGKGDLLNGDGDYYDTLLNEGQVPA
jgi:hypothetical protein